MASPQATQAQAPSVPGQPQKNGKKLPLLLGATLLVVGGGGVVGYLRFARAQPAKDEARLVDIDPAVADLETFTLNLPDEETDRYLRVGLQIALDRADVAAQINAQGLGYARLRDRVLSLLSARSVIELTTHEGREALRADIARVLAPLLEQPPFCDAAGGEPAHVLEVYFSEFLVQ